MNFTYKIITIHRWICRFNPGQCSVHFQYHVHNALFCASVHEELFPLGKLYGRTKGLIPKFFDATNTGRSQANHARSLWQPKRNCYIRFHLFYESGTVYVLAFSPSNMAITILSISFFNRIWKTF